MEKHKNKTALVTLWANAVVAVLMTAMVLFLPLILNWYEEKRWLTQQGWWVLLICFYGCAAFIAPALWNVDRLLRDILRGAVFTEKNVRRIRRIVVCCAAVSLICIPAAVAYTPLVLLVVMLVFLCLTVSVVASVMSAAVKLREENDLTI